MSNCGETAEKAAGKGTAGRTASATSGLPRRDSRPLACALRPEPSITARERELREVSRPSRNTDLMYRKKKPGRSRAFSHREAGYFGFASFLTSALVASFFVLGFAFLSFVALASAVALLLAGAAGVAFSVVLPVWPFGAAGVAGCALVVSDFGACAYAPSENAEAISTTSSFFNMESPVMRSIRLRTCAE